MFNLKYVSTDSFLMIEVLNESNTVIDSLVIQRRYANNVLHFYKSKEDYIEEYQHLMKDFVQKYEEKLDFDSAIETRSNAEFDLYKTLMDI